jgi:MoxR-like ATPase
MRPPIANLPSVDPRTFLRENGPGALATSLRERGVYCIQEQPLEALAESLESGVPHLLEGNRGSGKSALADALSSAMNLPRFHLQSNRGLTVEEMLFGWDRETQKAAEPDRKWSRDHLILGEVLGAFDFVERAGSVALLQIDEVDKLDERHQDMLLGLLQDGFHDVPRLRPNSRVGITSPGRPWPVVILTSNNRASDRDQAVTIPLRSRCAYCWIPDPTPLEEIRIIRTRVPDAPESLLRAVVKLVDALRGLATVADKPGLRETIRLTIELHKKGLESLDEYSIERHLCHIAKNRDDSLNVRNAARFLAGAVSIRNPRLDELVDAALRGDRSVRAA